MNIVERASGPHVLIMDVLPWQQVKMAQPYRDEDGRCPYDMLLREGQVHCELSVVDPSNQCAPALTAWPQTFFVLVQMLNTSQPRMCWA